MPTSRAADRQGAVSLRDDRHRPLEHEPNPQDYHWTIAFSDRSSRTSLQRLGRSPSPREVMYEGQATDIAGFVVVGDYLVN